MEKGNPQVRLYLGFLISSLPSGRTCLVFVCVEMNRCEPVHVMSSQFTCAYYTVCDRGPLCISLFCLEVVGFRLLVRKTRRTSPLTLACKKVLGVSGGS